MKTLQDLLKEIAEPWTTINKTFTNRNYLRDLLKTEDMFIGYSDRKLDSTYIKASLSNSLDEMIATNPDTTTDDIRQYFTIKYFIEADDITKKNIIANKILNATILQSDECYRRFIEPKWYKKLWLARDKSQVSSYIWDFLMCVEDFDNITDESIKDIAHSTSYGNISYTITCMLFGKEKVIPLIIQSLQENAESRNKILNNRIDEDEDIMTKIFTGLDDETVKKCRPNYCMDKYLKLCIKDSRYLIHAESFLEEDANWLWEKSDKYNDLIRYCAIIAKCCHNKNIPSYQLSKIKIFASLIKMYTYDYKNVFEAIKNSFNQDGSIKQEVLTLSKPKKVTKINQIYYCVIKDGNIQIFKTEEERTKANIDGDNINLIEYNPIKK